MSLLFGLEVKSLTPPEDVDRATSPFQLNNLEFASEVRALGTPEDMDRAMSPVQLRNLDFVGSAPKMCTPTLLLQLRNLEDSVVISKSTTKKIVRFVEDVVNKFPFLEQDCFTTSSLEENKILHLSTAHNNNYQTNNQQEILITNIDMLTQFQHLDMCDAIRNAWKEILGERTIAFPEIAIVNNVLVLDFENRFHYVPPLRISLDRRRKYMRNSHYPKTRRALLRLKQQVARSVRRAYLRQKYDLDYAEASIPLPIQPVVVTPYETNLWDDDRRCFMAREWMQRLYRPMLPLDAHSGPGVTPNLAETTGFATDWRRRSNTEPDMPALEPEYDSHISPFVGPAQQTLLSEFEEHYTQHPIGRVDEFCTGYTLGCIFNASAGGFFGILLWLSLFMFGYTTTMKWFSPRTASMATVKKFVKDYNALKRCIGYTETALEMAHQSINVIDEVNRFKQILLTMNFSALTDRDRINLSDIKNIIHALYHFHQKENVVALEFASNLVITHPECINVCATAIKDGVDYFHLPYATANIGGESIPVTSESFAEHVKQYELDGTFVMPDILEPHGVVEDIQSNLSTFLGLTSATTITPADMKHLSAQYTYINLVDRYNSKRASWIVTMACVAGRFLFGVDPMDVGYQTFITEILDSIKYEREANLFSDKVRTTKVRMLETIAKYEKACELSLNPRMNTVPRFMASSFQTSLRLLTDLAFTARTGLKGAEKRQEPTMVFLTGLPGSGKGGFTLHACQGLSKLDGKPCLGTDVYDVRCGAKFMSGYTCQKFVIVDDIFQTSDIIERKDQAMFIIDAIKTTPYILDMAEIKDKGNVAFDSEYVFASTNLANAGIDLATLNIGIQDPRAFKRRLHVVLHREEKYTSETRISELLFRVDQCVLEAYVGKRLTSVEAIHLIHKVRAYQTEKNSHFGFTDDELNDLYNPQTMVDFDAKQFEPHSGTMPKDAVVSAQSIFATCIDLKLHPWSSEHMSWFYLAFAVLMVALAAAPLMMWLFPGKLDSSEGFVDVAVGDAEPHSIPKKFLNLIRTHNIQLRKQWKKERDQTESRHEKFQRVQNEAHKENKALNAKHFNSTMHAHTGDINFDLTVQNKLTRSLLFLAAKSFADDGVTEVHSSTCVGTHIADGWVMTCAHWYVQHVKFPKTNVYMLVDGAQHIMNLPLDLDRFENVDVVFFQLPKNINRPPQTLTYFVDDVAPDLKSGSVLTLAGLLHTAVPNIKQVTVCAFSSVVQYQSDEERFFLDETYAYNGAVAKGDSGSLLVWRCPQGAMQILGMHVCGQTVVRSKTIGVALPVTQQLLRDVIKPTVKDLPPLIVAPAEMEMHSGNPCGFPLEVDYVVAPNLAVKLSGRNKIKRSKLFGWCGNATFVPTHMGPYDVKGEQINPLYLGLKKMRQSNSITTVLSDRTFAYLKQLYPRDRRYSRILTWDEALNGCPELNVSGIYAGTSPGYPLNLESNGKGKMAYLTKVGNRLEYVPSFLERCKQELYKLEQGTRMDVLWQDCLKEETRELSKVELGKTRVFSASNLIYLIVTRKYCHGLLGYTMEDPVGNPIAVGIDAHSVQWAQLRSKLDTHHGSVISGDFAAYDGTIPLCAAQMAGDFMNWWFDDGFSNVRNLLFLELTNAKHIAEDKVYTTVGSHPTGDCLTWWWNSIINLIITHHVLTIKMGFSEDSYVSTCYGDDAVHTLDQVGVTVSDMALHYKQDFDMDFTHWSKKVSTEVDTLTNIRFIGRMFAPNGRAPLDFRVVVETLYWYKHEDEQFAMLATVESFFHELSHFTEAFFDDNVEFFLNKARVMVPSLVPAIKERLKTYHNYQLCKYNPMEVKRPFVNDWADGDKWVPHSGVMQQTDVRSAEEPAITQLNEVGAIRDQGSVEMASVDNMLVSPVHRPINLKEYDLNQALERLYTIDVLNISSSAATNTNLGDYDLFTLLYNQVFIAQKANDFRGIITAMEVGLRFNSNQTLYGRILVEYIPRSTHEQFTSASVFRASGSPHVLVSASAADTVKFEIPFIHPKRYLRLDSFEAGELGIIRIWVLHPITSTLGNDANAQLVITAQLKNTTLVLPHSQTLPYFQPHSGKMPRVVNKEAAAKSKGGLITGSLISTQIMKAGVAVFDFCDKYGPALMTTAAMMGLSMPTSVAAVAPTKVVSYNDNVYGKGLSYIPKLAMDPENAISTEPIIGGISHDEMDLAYMMGTPALIGTTSWVEGSNAQVIMFAGPFGESYNCFVDLISKQFAFRSGSYKVKLYITASHFHTVKMVFWLTDDPNTDASWEECYYVLVDIQGDTEVELTIPYMEQAVMRRVNTGTQWGLYAKMLAWSAPSTTLSCPIHIACYKAAGPDFRVENYLDTVFTPTNNPRAEFAKVFPALESHMKAYDPGNVVQGERHTTLREIIHRMHAYKQPVAFERVYSNLPFPCGVAGANSYIGLEKWGCFFRFRRGSVRAKYLLRDARYVEALTIYNNYSVPNYVFGAYLSQPTNPVIELEVPYYSDILFLDNSSSTDNVSNHMNFYSTTTTTKYMLKSAGDDFSFHFLVLPPPGAFTYANSPYGQAGLMAWAQAGAPG